MAPDNFRRYIDAGILLGQVTKARAEELVREMIDAGEVQRDQAQDWVEDVVDKSRKTTETLLTTVKSEVEAQLSLLGLGSLDDLAKRVADVLRDSGAPARRPVPADPDSVVDARTHPTSGTTSRPSASSVRGAAKQAPAKKAPVKKTAAKKTAVKKTAAKKTAVKKAPAKKTAARSVGADRRRPGGGAS